MARYALITAAFSTNSEPVVLLEDEGKPLQALLAPDGYLEQWDGPQGLPTKFEEIFRGGWSYSDIEVNEYAGDAKTRIDNIIKTRSLPKEEATKKQELLDKINSTVKTKPQ